MPLELLVQLLNQLRIGITLKSHFSRQDREVLFVLRQVIGLQAKRNLHPVFQVTQEDVSVAEFFIFLVRQKFAVVQFFIRDEVLGSRKL